MIGGVYLSLNALYRGLKDLCSVGRRPLGVGRDRGTHIGVFSTVEVVGVWLGKVLNAVQCAMCRGMVS